MNNHTFCRALLTNYMVAVRKVTTVAERKAAWAWGDACRSDCREFHGPNEFYWYGSACCLTNARFEGWAAWMERYHPDPETDDDDDQQIKETT